MALQASSKVKGITIEIGADTSKFGYEMAQIRKEATLITKDMRSVDEAMKLNPENIEKAADKLKLLREAASNAEKKVNTIKAAIDALNREYTDKSVKEYTEQFQHLERQLESASREQEVANARLKDFETNAGIAGQSAVSLGDLIKGNLIASAIQTGLKKLVELAQRLAKAFIDAQKELFNFAKSTVDVAAQYNDALGYTEQLFGRNADAITQWVKDNSSSLRIAISDMQVYANNYATAFSALGLKSGEMVEFTEKMLSLSADIRAATGKDVGEINDALTRSFTSSLRNLRQFGVFIGEADIKMQAMKDGIVEFSGDQDALTEALQKSTKAAAAYEALLKAGVDDTEALSAAEDTAVAAQEELNAVLSDGETELTSAQRATALYNLVLEKLAFLTGQNERESGLYNSQLAEWKTNIENLKLAIGTELLPVFTSFIAELNNFIESPAGQELKTKIVDQFKEWGEAAKQMIEDGELERILNLIIEKAPEIIDVIGDIETFVIKNLPLVGELVDKILQLFGIETENQKIKKAFLEVEGQIKQFATNSGTDIDTMITAINSYAETHEADLLDIYTNWSEYQPKISEYINQITTDADGSKVGLDEALKGMTTSTQTEVEKQISWWDRLMQRVSNVKEFVSAFFSSDMWDKVFSSPDGATDKDGNPIKWDFGSNFGNFGAPHAMGGPVSAGQLLRVNDDAGRRIEAFIPSVPGTILNGNQTDKIMNNYNNSHTMGDLNLYVIAQGASARELADELGPLVQSKLRMSGARL